ncbi:MAG: sugar ABC transporter permease [Spirochaetaceae bacterium]|nr:sugar ABC transporter permease [Spirochaetaceae bacterium]
MLKKEGRSRWFLLWYILPAFVLYTLFMLIPILDSMRMSFYTGKGIIPTEFVGFDNYIKLFTKYPFNERFWNAFSNNIKFFLMVTLYQNVLGFLVAVLLTRGLKLSNLLKKISFIPTTLSVLVVGFLFSMIFNPIWGIFNRILTVAGLGSLIRPWLGDPVTALPILAFVVSWQFFGESIIFYTAGIDAIDEEILEAARIDGAGFFGEIWHIILPSILPIVGIVTVLIFVGDFTQFDIVYAMSTSMGNPGYSTDIFGSLFYRTAFSSPERGGWGMGMGATVATMMFVFVFFGVSLFLLFFNKKRAKLS